MFKFHEFWKAIDPHTLAIYFCFEDLESGKYCVQNVEFYRLPLKGERQLSGHKNAMELFMEESPLSRCDWASSLPAAIKLHDETFEN